MLWHFHLQVNTPAELDVCVSMFCGPFLNCVGGVKTAKSVLDEQKQ